QVQFLVNHRDATVDAIGRRPEGHGALTDLQIAAVGDVGAAENLQQGRLARAVLAHQRMNGAGVGDETAVGQRLDARKYLANGVEPQAAAIIYMCIHESLRRSPLWGRGLPIVNLRSGRTLGSLASTSLPETDLLQLFLEVGTCNQGHLIHGG